MMDDAGDAAIHVFGERTRAIRCLRSVNLEVCGKAQRVDCSPPGAKLRSYWTNVHHFVSEVQGHWWC